MHHVDHDVHDHNERRADQCTNREQREVERANTVHEHATKAGQTKDRFGEDGTAHEARKIKSEQHDDGDQTRTKHVMHVDVTLGQSLGNRSLHMLLIQRLPNVRPGHARIHTGEHDAERRCRKQDVVHPPEDSALTDRNIAASGEDRDRIRPRLE